MNELAESLLFRIGLASAFLASAAIIAWGMLNVLRCQSPFVHRTTWCLVLAQSVLIFQLPISIPWKSYDQARQLLSEVAPMDYPSASMDSAFAHQALPADSPVAEAPQQVPFKHWSMILFVAWSFGFLMILVQWSVRYAWFVRSLPIRECENELWTQEWNDVLAARSIAERIPLYISDSAGPMLCRWPDGQRVVVPRLLWSTLPQEQRQSILCHELAHFERNDLLKILVANLVAAVHWFNPLAWFAVRRFEDSIEWTCDSIVETSKPDAKLHYAKALLALGSNSPKSTAWASAVFGGGLAARIRRIVSSGNATDSRSKVLMTLGILIGLSAVHVVRVDLIAKEPNQKLENIIAADYFIAPVVTGLQMWKLSGIAKPKDEPVSVYANVNGRSFFSSQRPTLDMNRFNFDSFLRDLASVRTGAQAGTTAICIDFENIDEQGSSTSEMGAKVESAFQLKTKEAGIENVRFVKRIVNDGSKWRNLEADAALSQTESRKGNETVSVFPIETAFSRFLIREASSANSKSVDCFINVATVLPIDAEEAFTVESKEVIRNAISELKLPKGASALLMVHFASPQNWNNIQEKIPQTKTDSEFQRGAVNFLKSLGFERVGTNVDVSSVMYLGMHD